MAVDDPVKEDGEEFLADSPHERVDLLNLVGPVIRHTGQFAGYVHAGFKAGHQTGSNGVQTTIGT
ncbi:hypothetical protein [Methylorubrum extorquens]